MTRLVRLIALALVLGASGTALAQDYASGSAPRAEAPRSRPAAPRSSPDVAHAPAYYVVAAGTPIRSAPVASAPVLETLRVREGVRVMRDTVSFGAEWREVQFGGTHGFMPAQALSNVWLRVDKSDRTVYVYRGAELVRSLPADVAVSEGDKVRRSGRDETEQWRMPEGVFHVVRLNDESSYYRAFVLSYPNPVHARRGLEDGIITAEQYRAIVAADAAGEAPPMGTRLGGMIELHGSGSGRREAWTRGCVALRNVHMDELWDVVQVGTPVVIEP